MYDYIIVGQGIAGTILAHTFLKNRKNILIINSGSSKTPSAVAAGIYNPITGKRMVKTWKADVLFPFLIEYYKALEALLKESFLFEMSVYKPFSSYAEQNYFVSTKNLDGDFGRILPSNNLYGNYIYNDFGGFETSSSGYVNVARLLSLSGKHFQKLGIYRSEIFQYHDLILKEEGVSWKDVNAKKIIFCEGPQIADNPFFQWLPFVYTKGEILEISLTSFPDSVIFNKGVFVLPNYNTHYKVGSTYEWNFSDNEISSEGRRIIEAKLKELVKTNYIVTGQKCGIRPTVKDRRPIFGIHPQYKTLGVFNGLGTKGISLAPFFSQQFHDYLEYGKDLDMEVNIERFYAFL